MASGNTPELKDWDALQLVVLSVNLIVDDAPPVNVLHGLMGLLSQPIQKPQATNSESRLKAQLRSTPTLLTGDTDKKLLELLPGLDDIGKNRAERISNLSRRLSELPAYHWLSKTQAFIDAKAALQRLAKASPASKYAYDDALFRMLDALIYPLQVFHLLKERGLKSNYPTKADVQDAFVHARALQAFLRDHDPVYGLFDMPSNARNVLDAVTMELDANRKTYSKPKDNGQINERDFRDQLVRRLYLQFDGCSNKLLKPLLGLVDYDIGERDLTRCINELLGPEKIKRAKKLSDALRNYKGGGA